jgi:hypothetical protein
MTTSRSAARRVGPLPGLVLALAAAAMGADSPRSNRTIVAEVVALDQSYFLNRLGAAQPGGMIFALRDDVVPVAGAGPALQSGKVTLRQGKRPRPLVLRMNVGDSLEIQFQNLLAANPRNPSAATRYAGLHIGGLDLAPSGAQGIASDSSWVGKNPGPSGSLVPPGGKATYTYFARASGTFLITSGADDSGADSSSQASEGLFGAVNVQPEWAEWYRSQVTRQDLLQAMIHMPGPYRAAARAQAAAQGGEGPAKPVGTRLLRLLAPRRSPEDARLRLLESHVGKRTWEPYTLLSIDPERHSQVTTDVLCDQDGRLYSPEGHPLIDYSALYAGPARQGLPILNMLQTVKGPTLFATSLTPPEVDQARVGLVSANSYVTAALNRQFETRGGTQPPDERRRLSNNARITDAGGPAAWLITDPGKGVYLVQEVEQPAPGFLVSAATLKLVHSDLTAMITGPRAGRFGFDIDGPSFFTNPTIPDRRQPYREFTIIYHMAPNATQAFPAQFNMASTKTAFNPGQDAFAINYGTAAIGAEVLANRLGVGPMGNADAVDLKFEEFFLSSWAVGDPAMVVDVNASDQAKAGVRRTATKPMFTTNSDNALIAALDAGKADGLRAAFAGSGIALSGAAIASPICAGKEWIILDPGGSAPAAPGRGRFPVIARATTANGPPATVFDIYPGPLGATPGVAGSATVAHYPDDPSNVYHSNIRDHVKFRILHAGPGPSHVHHLHAHQWLHSPDSSDSQYLDSQLIIPGSAYTLEIVYNGTGNRNLTVGDSIFHCHFYPHFAKGMWSLWRAHDVFEWGTRLDDDGRAVAFVDEQDRPVYRGTRAGEPPFFVIGPSNTRQAVTPEQMHRTFNRALPDGEITTGTPIPAIVPLPTLAEPPMPAPVRLTDLAPFYPEGEGQGRRVYVEPKNAEQIDVARKAKRSPLPEPVYDNPGYPFFIPGVAGHRPPHPPLDFGWREDPKTGQAMMKDGKKVLLDGGLPRHVALGGQIVKNYQTRWDFTRDFIAYDAQHRPVAGKFSALGLPEEGTPVERGAMAQHSHRTIPSYLPNGDPGNVTRNGLPGLPGAPYAPPMVDDYGNADYNTRRYQAAVIQTDVVQNKLGWHFPQQRFLTLWEDVGHTVGGDRAPQPLFFRANTDDTIQFWHTNLVPSYYQVDDFQVRTPTDVIGQHIHNVKFDVTSSDGGANGYNYEDGTFSPDEVRERIDAINRPGGQENFSPGLLRFDSRTGFVDACAPPETLAVVPVKDAYPPRQGAGDPAHGVFGPPPPGQNWDGAQTTIQLWDADPLLGNSGTERTLRTIFTHDHLGPSTHQQVGLYAGLVVEPEGSLWYLPDGERMNSRLDGGPTNWEGYIVTSPDGNSYREFAIEFQDTQLAYANTSRIAAGNEVFQPHGNPATGPAAFDVGATTPPQTRNEIGGFIAILDRAQLPAAFPQIFASNGIPLSAGAGVTVINQGSEWRVREAPRAAVNAGTSYIVWAANFIDSVDGVKLPFQVPTSLYVGTPEIEPGWVDSSHALNPPLPLATDPALGLGTPFPQLVSNGRVGTYSMNYRNESVIARVSPLAANDQLVKQIDMSYTFNSLTDRRDPRLNLQPTPGSPIDPSQPNGFKFPPSVAPLLPPHSVGTPVPGVNEPGDPFTPMLRAYAGDPVQVRTLVGAHTLAHSFQIQGVRWSFEPYYQSSGYRNAQGMGISEHFEMLFKLPHVAADHPGQGLPPFADYLVSPSSTVEGLANGDWTIMRAFVEPSGRPGTPTFLTPLPNNPIEDVRENRRRLADRIKQVRAEFDKLNTKQDQVQGNLRVVNVTATTVFQALPGKKLNFTPRPGAPSSFQLGNFFLFVPTADLDSSGRLKPDAPREPLILRARAGEWILVNLTNALPSGTTTDPVLTMKTDVGGGSPFIATAKQPLVGSVLTSRQVGLHPALVNYDVTDSNGINIGFNPDATVAPGQTRSFLWFAGYLSVDAGKVREEPIEYGATNLVSAEMMVQPQFGLVGALIVEPPGSNWTPDLGTRAAALVTPADGGTPFREFVLVGQNVVANTEWGAFNYRTESFNARQPLPSPTLGYAKAFSNAQLNPPADPATPIFRASAGIPVRFRLVMPSTSTVNQAPFVFRIHGHGWQEEPYVANGTRIGSNPRSQVFGAQQVVPYEAFNFVLDQAGGPFKVTGDFLYETYQQSAGLGTWGLLRVEDGVVAVTGTAQVGTALTISGTYQPTAADAGKPATIRVSSPSGPLGEANVSGHSWTFTTDHSPSDPIAMTIRGSLGGETTIALPPPASTAPEKVAGNPVSKGAPTRP